MMRSAKRQTAWDRTAGDCFYCGSPLRSDRDVDAASEEYRRVLDHDRWGAHGDASKRYETVVAREMIVEHMTPLTRGGGDVADNRTAACRRCNSRKHTRTVDEFRVFLMLVDARAPTPFPGEEKRSPGRDWLIVCTQRVRGDARLTASHLGVDQA